MRSTKELVNLKDRKAVVAGGGIGSTIVSSFADFGVDVALIDLDIGRTSAVKDELEERIPVRILVVPAMYATSNKLKMPSKQF